MVPHRSHFQQSFEMRKPALDFVQLFVSRYCFHRRQIRLFGLDDVLAFAGLLAREVYRVREVVKLTLAQLPIEIALTMMALQDFGGRSVCADQRSGPQ